MGLNEDSLSEVPLDKGSEGGGVCSSSPALRALTGEFAGVGSGHWSGRVLGLASPGRVARGTHPLHFPLLPHRPLRGHCQSQLPAPPLTSYQAPLPPPLSLEEIQKPSPFPSCLPQRNRDRERTETYQRLCGLADGGGGESKDYLEPSTSPLPPPLLSMHVASSQCSAM